MPGERWRGVFGAGALDLQSKEVEDYVVCWGDDLCHDMLKARETGVWRV